MTQRMHRRPFWLWMLAPTRALAAELGVQRGLARPMARLVRRRRRSWIPLVFVIQIGVMVGWIALISSFVGIYETVTTFGPDGAITSEVTTGPFGTTTLPLLLGVLIGPFLALVLGAVAGLATHFLCIDREARRCARTPACFGCGYDLSAVVASRCPECGCPRPTGGLQGERGLGRTVRS